MDLPDLTGAAWTDGDLDALRVAVLTEQERRATLAQAVTDAEILITLEGV